MAEQQAFQVDKGAETPLQVITCARNAQDLQDLEKLAQGKGWHVKVYI